MEFMSSYKRGDLNGNGIINNKIKFKILDISASGAKIYAERSFELNEIINLKFVLKGHFYTKNLSVNARVVRSIKDSDKNIYGIHFINLQKGDVIEIDEIVHAHCSETGRIYK